MVNDPLCEVEQAPAEEQPACEGTSTDYPPPVGGPSPEHADPREYSDPGCGVEKTIPERVCFQALNGGLGVASFAAEHVVPLKHLVKKDAVRKPAQADAEQDSGGAGAGDSLGAVVVLAGVPTGIDCRSREGRVPPADARLNAHSGFNGRPLVVCLSSHSRQTVCLAAGRAGAD